MTSLDNVKAPEKPDTKPVAVNGETEIYIDPVMEKRIIRKFDMLALPQYILIIVLAYLDRTNIGEDPILPMVCFLRCALFIDKTRAGNARIFGFEEDLGLKGNEFANLSSLFYVSYVIFELPWVLAVQKYGANLVLAIAIIGWSAVTIGTGFCHNYGQLVACRLLLGFLEAGLFPALTFLLSTTYPRNSQGKRVAALYGATAISGAFGGLIAYGIQLMGARQGLEAWRWLFIIEGAISLFLGLIAMLTLPKSASSAWFLTKEETELIEQRLKRDVAYAGEDHGFSMAYIWMALNDVVVWVSALSIFCAGIPLFGFGIFLPTIIRGMG
jgi:MFS family permease